MFVKRQYKSSALLPILLFVVSFYIVLRLGSECYINGFSIQSLNNATATLFAFDKIELNKNTLMASVLVSGMILLLYYNQQARYKINVEGKTYGSSDWGKPSDLEDYKEKDILDNTILTKTEQISRDMSKSKRSRNMVLLGRPGTGKSRYFFKPNILNATGTIVVTDPKGELLRDCGYSLKKRGYKIKVLDLTNKYKSNKYNCLKYLKKAHVDPYAPDASEEWDSVKIAEDDVMSLIDVIFKNTKSDNIESTSGDPFWEKAEMIYLQALIYYIIYRCKDPKDKILPKVLELMRLSNPDPTTGQSELDRLFDEWALEDPTNIGVKQWKHYKTASQSPKMMSTIIMTATSRLASLNIAEVEKLISEDDMEMENIGAPGKKGKIAYFIITDPGDSAFNFIANIFYSQLFKMIKENAERLGCTSLPTPVDIYMDEWAQLGTIPRFVEQLAFVRGYNVGIVIGLQSLSQLKEKYKDSWETALDCCDYFIFLGSQSKETLDYLSNLLGKKTYYKKNDSRTYGARGSSSRTWDEVGRELATPDELSRMEKGKCVLKIAGMYPFYSDLYDLSKHPNYKDIYEPWKKGDPSNDAKEYDHLNEIHELEKQHKGERSLIEAGIQEVESGIIRPISINDYVKREYRLFS